jgi:MTH538 TIR-like domain (DUF1863)
MIGQPSSPPANALSGLFSPFASNSLVDLVAPPVAPVRAAPTYALATVKRKGFFSFHYADIIRVILVGTETWSRPWVRYEIARSVVDKKGLLAVHINNLRHHHRLAADVLGDNPLAFMAVGCPNTRGIYFLYERVLRQVVRYGQATWERQTMPLRVSI